MIRKVIKDRIIKNIKTKATLLFNAGNTFCCICKTAKATHVIIRTSDIKKTIEERMVCEKCGKEYFGGKEETC